MIEEGISLSVIGFWFDKTSGEREKNRRGKGREWEEGEGRREEKW